MVSAFAEHVLDFFVPAAATLTVEQVLADKKLIILAGANDVKICSRRFVPELPTMNGVWTTGTQTNSKGVRTPGTYHSAWSLVQAEVARLRSPSTGFLKDPSTTKEHVSVYVHHAYFDSINWEENNRLAAKQLIRKVMEKCAINVGKPIEGKLDMHMCFIFDEAGSSHTKHWFESRENLASLCTEAETVATSVNIVVAGTAITGRQLSSTKDAYFFRMKPWEEGDLLKILEGATERSLLVRGEENVNTVAKVIFAHPKLGALATNARSVSFLVDEILELSKGCTHSSWEMQLDDEWTPVLVTQVVNRYIANNSLAELDDIERRRVAAFVLRALQQLTKDGTTMPTWKGLEHTENPQPRHSYNTI